VQCKGVCRGGRAALMGEGLGTNLFQQPEQLRRRSLDYDRSSMQMVKDPRVAALSCVVVLLLSACNKSQQAPPDHPRLTAKVAMRDVTFQSAAPNRDMPYRVVLPLSVVAGQKLPVVYWLHGGGGGFRDWSNSDVAQFAERGLVLVMPEGNSSYYSNSVDRPQECYEDSIVGDLIADVESKLPRLQVAQAPLHRMAYRWEVLER